jgi:hypothetical protein
MSFSPIDANPWRGLAVDAWDRERNANKETLNLF